MFHICLSKYWTYGAVIYVYRVCNAKRHQRHLGHPGNPIWPYQQVSSSGLNVKLFTTLRISTSLLSVSQRLWKTCEWLLSLNVWLADSVRISFILNMNDNTQRYHIYAHWFMFGGTYQLTKISTHEAIMVWQIINILQASEPKVFMPIPKIHRHENRRSFVVFTVIWRWGMYFVPKKNWCLIKFPELCKTKSSYFQPHFPVWKVL